MVDDSFTKALLHCDGADASTTFTDESGKTVTPSGNAQIDTAQSVFGGASGLFDGSGDYLTIASNSDLAIGTGKFTIDYRFRLAELPSVDGRYKSNYCHGDSNIAGGFVTAISQTDIITFVRDGLFKINGTTSLSKDTWYHFAIVGNGGANGSRNIKIYLNGTQEGSTYTFDYDFTQLAVTIGKNPADSVLDAFNGWLDEMRVSIGVERWTANFTPPTAAYSPEATTNASFLLSMI
jgi:hypothetical protein